MFKKIGFYNLLGIDFKFNVLTIFPLSQTSESNEKSNHVASMLLCNMKYVPATEVDRWFVKFSINPVETEMSITKN